MPGDRRGRSQRSRLGRSSNAQLQRATLIRADPQASILVVHGRSVMGPEGSLHQPSQDGVDGEGASKLPVTRLIYERALIIRENYAAKSSFATYEQPANCQTRDLPSAA